MKKLMLLMLVCGLVASMVSAANAYTVSYTDAITLAGLNWTGVNAKSVSIQKFDTTGNKQLQSVTFTLLGHMEGIAAFESLDAMPSTITLSVSSAIQLQKPDLSMLTSTPTWSATYSAAAKDGVTDWAGPSGATNAFAESTTVTASTSSVSDLAIFSTTGTNYIVLPVVATATSIATGSGNLIPWFETSASADVKVTYEYTIIPEPSALIALGTGIIGLAGFGFRRKY